MASKKDVVRLTDADFEQKSRKVAPTGKHNFVIDKEHTKITPGTESNVLKVALRIPKGPHKGVLVFDNIAAHVGWKIAQLLMALGLTRKKIATLKDLPAILKVILGKELRAVISKTDSEEWGPQNKVRQYLPLGSDEDDDIDEDEEDDEDDEDLDDDDDEEDEEDEDEEDEEDDEDEEDEEEDDDEEDEDEDEDDDDEDEDEDEDEEDEDEDEDEDEEDDEDEEETPAPRGRKVAAKKSAAKKSAAKKPAAKKTTKKR